MKQILTAACILALCSCAKTTTLSGVVADATMNTVTVTTDGGDTYSFNTMDADKTACNGIIIGTPITVTYKGEIKDDFAEALTVETPYEYNHIVGSWIQPVEGMEGQMQGFTLDCYGKATSINMATLLYSEWNVDGKTLTLKGQSLGNGQTIDFAEEYTIDSLNDTTLVLSCEGVKFTYTRQM